VKRTQYNNSNNDNNMRVGAPISKVRRRTTTILTA